MATLEEESERNKKKSGKIINFEIVTGTPDHTPLRH